MGPRYLISALLLSSCLVAPVSVAAQEAAADATEVEEVVVTGQRASDRESLEKKREAVQAVEVVSADDVGKLPDQNVAEAVRRLPGVSVATDKGEGRYLIIRGIEPNLANVTINSQTASAPEPESRNVKLDDIPSALIGSVTVVKSLTPDLDANAIAGQVDINTLTAFDKGRRFFNVRAAGSTYDDTDDRGFEGDIAGGGLFGPDRQFGLVLALNYSKRPSYSQDILAGARMEVGDFDMPEEIDSRIYDPAWRVRQGAVANFDWRPTDAAKMYARLMYSKFDDEETRSRFRFFFPEDEESYSELSAAGGAFEEGATGRRLVRQRQEVTSTTTLALGGDFEVGPGTLSVAATHSLAKKEDPIRDEVEFRYNGPDITGTFENGSKEPESLVLSDDAVDPARYRFRSYKHVTREAEEDLNQVRADYKVPMEMFGPNGFLKFGAKYLHRDKFTDATGEVFERAGPQIFLTDFVTETVPTNWDGAYTFGPKINFDLFKDFFGDNPELFESSEEDQIIESLGEDYKVVETITAAYIMGSFDLGPLNIIPGIRVEKTEGDSKAIAVTEDASVDDTYNQFGSYSYTDWFPGVNVKYQVTPDLVARAAVTTAIGRPEYFQLAPTVSIDGDEVALGNPDLQPQESVNFDASLEYYFPDEGGISVGFFHKKIDNPIFASTFETDGTFGGIDIEDAQVSTFVNGSEAEVTGLEFAFQKPLTFLPSPFDGLGVNANMTFVDGKLKVPGRTGDTMLPKQAERIASAQVYYEKYGFSARVAYSYRSAYIDEIDTGDESGDSDIYFDELGTISAKVGYNITKQIEVFAEGNNLNNPDDYYYFGNPGRFAEVESFGRSFRVGLSFTY